MKTFEHKLFFILLLLMSLLCSGNISGTVYSIVGTFPGLSWETDLIMTQKEAYIYEAKYTTTVSANVKYEYKLRSNFSWEGYQLPSVGNAELMFCDGDDPDCYPVGTYTLTFIADVLHHQLECIPEPALTIRAKSYARQYGEENPPFGYEVTNGNLLSGSPSLSCSATKYSPVGTYDIVISKGTVSEAVNLVNGTLTITPAPLTISVGNYTKVEGEDNPVFAPIFIGFKNNETSNVLTKQPAIMCSATKDSPAGTYPVTVSGAEAQNYNINYKNGTLTIVKKSTLATQIKVHPIEIYYFIHDSRARFTNHLKAELLPNDVANKKVTWVSTAPEIASIVETSDLECIIRSGDGNHKRFSKGAIRATTTDGSNLSDSCRIVMYWNPQNSEEDEDGIPLEPLKLSIIPDKLIPFKIGNSTLLTAMFNDNEMNKWGIEEGHVALKWESLNNNVVTVDSTGMAKAIATGMTQIRVTATVITEDPTGNTVVVFSNDKPDVWEAVCDTQVVDFKDEQKGDVNGDGVVDVADIATVISVMAKGGIYAAADVNGDGVVDVADIATIISEMAARARMLNETEE